ncbi:MAG: DegT/DnrJ/EryC1/StrS family aminotransferase, partial [Phenylobacterium sp.]|nr:DegT/DnrJ/EryC1/StrS family aminotransferase [Phenylobacterium sp.]
MTNERIFLSPPHMLGSEREMLLEAFDSGYVAPAGPMIERFEAAFAEYVGGRYGVALSSGTAALHLALRIVGVGRDDLVAAPTLTFIGGVAAIDYQGAAPIFVDADPGDWCMSPKGLEDAFDLAERAGKRIAAVVPTDL